MVGIPSCVPRRLKRNVNCLRAMGVRSNQVYLRRDYVVVCVGGRTQRIISFTVGRAMDVIYEVANRARATTRVMYRFRFVLPGFVVGLAFLRERRTRNGASCLRVPTDCGLFLQDMRVRCLTFFKFSLGTLSDSKRCPQVGALWQLFLAQFRMCFLVDRLCLLLFLLILPLLSRGYPCIPVPSNGYGFPRGPARP